MNKRNTIVLDMLDGIGQYNTDHPLTPPVAAATALFGEGGTVAQELRDYHNQQVTGRTGFRGNAAIRRSTANTLFGELRTIRSIARALDRATFPDAREDFRMPVSRSYANLAATARSFALHAQAIEQVFLDRGRPATFVADLNGLADQLQAAALPRHASLQSQVGATAALGDKARRGVAIMRELDAIITPLVAGNPELLAAWKNAAQIARTAPAEPESTPANPPEPSVTP